MNTEEVVYLDAGSHDLLDLQHAVNDAVENGRHFRVTMDAGTFKFKAGEGMWSPPITSHKPNGGY